MHKVAKKHKFKVLLHEKPFKGVNGSGKHNNWSLSTNTGKNLLAPGKTPKNNLLFLTTIVNVVAAVAQYSDLIRVAIASAGNDHRLGASEAPPAIISVFLGKAISNIFDEIANTELENDDQIISDSIRLSIHNSIPEIMLDNTDRNRTSPFAFTGNKFEIRAVGSSANCSFVMSVMNTIVAKQFSSFYHQVNDLIKSGIKKEIAILQTIKELIKTSEFIRFEGDNYSKEWEEEAARRGLSNRKNTPDALDFLIEPRNIDAFVSQKVYTEKEIHARYEILNHQYTLTIQIEARILGDIAVNSVIPSALKYLNVLLDNITKSKALFDDVSLYQGQMELAKTISTHINDIKFNVDEMIESRKKCNSETHIPKQTKMYYELVFPYLERIRYHIDKLELLTDNSLWPMAKYRELMFIK
jgi:glutamine synthetase